MIPPSPKMRLLSTKPNDYRFKIFVSTASRPKYAILSHTWMADEEEVTFADTRNLTFARNKPGWSKLENARSQAHSRDLAWIWIDTCCIDKSSSAELSEAINSMFSWYRDASICFVYLADFQSQMTHLGHATAWHDSPKAEGEHEISRCRWFSRSWTLQEMLAPAPDIVSFFDAKWQSCGTLEDNAKLIAGATGIDHNVLRATNHRKQMFKAQSVAQKMCWTACRTSTRKEDRAYSLLGLFDVNMPIIYGEGDKAFARLQEAVMRTDPYDYTIFAWNRQFRESGPGRHNTLLAPSPDDFRGCEDLVSLASNSIRPYQAVAHGVCIEVPALRVSSAGGETLLAILPCRRTSRESSESIALMLYRFRGESRGGGSTDMDVQSIESVDSYLVLTEATVSSLTVRYETRMFRWTSFRKMTSIIRAVKDSYAPVVNRLFFRVARMYRDKIRFDEAAPKNMWQPDDLCFRLDSDTTNNRVFKCEIRLELIRRGDESTYEKLFVAVILEGQIELPGSKKAQRMKHAVLDFAPTSASDVHDWPMTGSVLNRRDEVCSKRILGPHSELVQADMRMAKFQDVNVLLVEMRIVAGEGDSGGIE